MENYPLVSIGIVTYNQKYHLKECVESCLSQDYPNTEIVIADDASDDGTQALIREYERRNPNKFVLRLTDRNRGITMNSNSCLAACSGTYITMLGGDDLMEPEKVTQQAAVLTLNPNIALCGTYTRCIDEHGKTRHIRKDFKEKKDPRYTLCELIESSNGIVPVVSYMFRKKHIPVNRYDSRLAVASDSLFYCQIASKGDIYILQETLSIYREHQSAARKLGYKIDSALSLSLMEYEFPRCHRAIKVSRARLFKKIGGNFFRQGEFSCAKQYFALSVSIKWSVKAAFLFLLLHFRLGSRAIWYTRKFNRAR